MRACPGLRHVMLLGIGARSSMDSETVIRRAPDIACRVASGAIAAQRPLGGSRVGRAKLAVCVGVAEW